MASVLSTVGMERAEKLLKSCLEEATDKLTVRLMECMHTDISNNPKIIQMLENSKKLEQQKEDLQKQMEKLSEEHTEMYEQLVEQLNSAYPWLNLHTSWRCPPELDRVLYEAKQKVVQHEFAVVINDTMNNLRSWFMGQLLLKSLSNWNADKFFSTVKQTLNLLYERLSEAIAEIQLTNVQINHPQLQIRLLEITNQFKDVDVPEIWNKY